MAKILIVEDEVNIRETIVDILESLDYQVIEAKNGLIGSIKAIKERPDLIISDVNMPEMDGFEMLDALNGCMHELIIPPFIFLTARVERSDIRQGMKLGADDYLTKPFKSSDLIDAIELKLAKRDQVHNSILKKERSNISSELHDSIQQLLVGAFLGFEGIKEKIDVFDANDQAVYKSALGLLAQANNDLRKYAHNIGRNEEIHDIKTALFSITKNLKQISGILVSSKCSINVPIDPKIQTQLYRITQEALSNIMKHSQASQSKISLTSDDNGVALVIKDNGCGFDQKSDSSNSGIGLPNIRNRAEEIGGHIEIKSVVGEGTEIHVTVKP